MTDPLDSDPRIDELFALPPEQFTAARNGLVRQLRDADQRELATVVGRLRRPTVAAWAVNQTVRTHREQFEALLSAGDQVRRAQRRALSGVRASEMRDVTRARRTHIEQLAQLAIDFLTDRGIAAEGHRGDIVATFDAASADDDIAASVGAARLSQALPVSPGFGALAGLTVFRGGDADDGDLADDAPASISGRAADDRADAEQTKDERAADAEHTTEDERAADAEHTTEDERAAEDERREQAALARRAAMRAVEEIRRRLTEAQAEATRAAAELTRADARAAAADQTAQVAEDRARRLRGEADDLTTRADRARSRSAQARQAAADLEARLHEREQQLQALDG